MDSPTFPVTTAVDEFLYVPEPMRSRILAACVRHRILGIKESLNALTPVLAFKVGLQATFVSVDNDIASTVWGDRVRRACIHDRLRGIEAAFAATTHKDAFLLGMEIERLESRVKYLERVTLEGVCAG